MPRARASTTRRIAGLAALGVAAASLLVGALTWSFASRTLRQALDDRLRGELTTLMRAGEREGRAAMIADIVARDAVPGEGGYLLLARDGRPIAGRVVATRPAPGVSDVVLRSNAEGRLPGRAVAVRLSGGEVLAVVGEARSLARIERTLLLISAGGLALMVAIGIAGAVLIGHAIDRRLQSVDATARAIIEGDLSRRMPVHPRNDEFDRLAMTLNRMLDHIGRLMDSLRHISDDIAHDLRTPLSRLRATLEAGHRATDEAARRHAIARGLVQLDGVIRLFATILRISEVEGGGLRAGFDAVRLDLLAADLVESYGPAATDGGRAMSLAAADGVVVRGDRDLLGQALVNLIENAIKHTPEGTSIQLSARIAAGAAELTVSDYGPGIPPAERAAALGRFGRGEASRSTAGYGLSLTLGAAIAAAHDAELVLDDAAPGLIVRLRFPWQV